MPTVRIRRRGTKAQQVVPAGFHTREEVKARLGLSDAEMLRLRTMPEFVATNLTPNGWALYSEAQLKRMEARVLDGSLFTKKVGEDGALATLPPQGARSEAVNENSPRVFEMLYNGIPPHVIVIQTKLPAQVVDQIRHDYDRMAGSMTIPREILERMNGVKRLNGRFPLRSPADILEVFQLADGARVCTTCRNVGASSECGGCVYQRAETDVKERLAAERSAPPAERRPRPSQPRVATEPEGVPERQARTGT